MKSSNNRSFMRNIVCATDFIAYNDENDSVKSFYLSSQGGFLENMNFVEGLRGYILLAVVSSDAGLTKFLAFNTSSGNFCTFESNGKDEPIRPGSIREIRFSDGPDFMGLPSDCAPIHFYLDPNFAGNQTKLLTLGWKTVKQAENETITQEEL